MTAPPYPTSPEIVASRVWDDAVDGFLGTATLTFMFPATETAAARQAAYTIHMTVGVESVDVTDGAVGVDIDEMISYDEMVKRSKTGRPSLICNKP